MLEMTRYNNVCYNASTLLGRLLILKAGCRDSSTDTLVRANTDAVG